MPVSSIAGVNDLLIIHSYGRHGSFSWVDDQAKGIKSAFGKTNYKFHEFELNTKSIPETQFGEKAKEAYEVVNRLNPRLVFLTDDNALMLMVPQIGKEIPIVFMGVNGNIRFDYPWLLEYPNVTGILERPLIKRTIYQMKDALSLDLKKVMVIMGTSPTGEAFFKNDLNEQEHFKIVRINVDVRRSDNIDRWYSWIKTSKKEGYDILIATNFYALVSSKGNKINVDEVSSWISKNSPLPTFSVHTGVVGKDKLVGGMIISGLHMGEAAGQVALDILEKSIKTNAIPYKTLERGQLIFSKQQLAKWKLSIGKKYLGNVSFVE